MNWVRREVFLTEGNGQRSLKITVKNVEQRHWRLIGPWTAEALFISRDNRNALFWILYNERFYLHPITISQDDFDDHL